MNPGGTLIHMFVSHRIASVDSVAGFWFRSSNDGISSVDVFHCDVEILDKMERRYILSKAIIGVCNKKLNL